MSAVAVTVDPKVKNAEQAADTMRDFVKNPPQDPAQAVLRFAEILNPSASVGAAIKDFFPAASIAVSLLSDLFGGIGAPSIGQLTLKAISDLSAQLSKGLATLEKNITREVFEQSQRTIDVVLSGVDEVARQQSATIVFTELGARAIADTVRLESAAMYESAQAQLVELRRNKLDQIQSDLESARAALMDQYQAALKKALAMVDALAPMILAALESVTQQAEQPQTEPGISARSLPSSGDDAANVPLMVLGLGGLAALALLYNSKKR